MPDLPPDDEDTPSLIIVCQGPPRCDLLGEHAIAAQDLGCVWCRRITVYADYEVVREPGTV